jgi:hypothetical protein
VVYECGTAIGCNSQNTKRLELRFGALLTEGGAERLELARAGVTTVKRSTVPANLDTLTPEKGNALYQTLRLEFKPREEGYEVTGPFCSLEPLSSSTSRNYTQCEPRLRALLLAEGASKLTLV